jgi:hypothetical protein
VGPEVGPWWCKVENPQLLPLLAPKSIVWIILDVEENPFIMHVCIFVPMLDPVFFKRFPSQNAKI